jgi:hypothetical protein
MNSRKKAIETYVRLYRPDLYQKNWGKVICEYAKCSPPNFTFVGGLFMCTKEVNKRAHFEKIISSFSEEFILDNGAYLYHTEWEFIWRHSKITDKIIEKFAYYGEFNSRHAKLCLSREFELMRQNKTVTQDMITKYLEKRYARIIQVSLEFEEKNSKLPMKDRLPEVPFSERDMFSFLCRQKDLSNSFIVQYLDVLA